MTVVAIDFGTSNTVVCTQDPVTQTPRTLKFDRISRQFETAGGTVSVIPSLVFVQEKQSILLGEIVRAQRLGFRHPDRLFQNFKRDLVADYRPPSRQLFGITYTPEQIAEQFLTEVWQQICQQLEPSQVVFTVPVGSFERYLNWFRAVGQTFAIPNLQLVDESTAAALGYAIQNPGALVLVVDFGGGTLDLSLVRTVITSQENAITQAEVVAKSDAYVGGVDIDSWIVEAYLHQISASREAVGELGWQTLLEMAEKLKIRLSTSREAKDSWFDDENFISYELHLTQAELAEILESRQLLEQLRQALDEVLTIALNKGIPKNQIEQVLLIGGSCQIPAVQQLIISYFGRQKVKLDKPFEAVAQGALTLGQQLQVQDELRHGYAIRLWEPYARVYAYFPLFTPGIRYPCDRPEPLILQVAIEGQTEIRLDIGEVADLTKAEVTFDETGRMTSSHLQHQASFHSLDAQASQAQANQVCIAHLNPPGERGVDRIEVYFEINQQRILLATVKDLLTGSLLVDREAIAKLH